MKKGKNKFFILGIVLVIVITLCSFISAEINVKNISIESNYFGGENIKGWINMSLTDVPYDTLVSGFNKNVFLLSFLNNNNLRDKAGISCSVVNCSVGYAVNGTLFNSLNLAEGTFTFVGFKIFDSEKITNISKLSLDISTDAGSKCSENMQVPLRIDILDDNSSEWSSTTSSYGISEVICGEPNYGCFENAESYEYIKKGISYCERIRVGPGAGIYTGVNITGSGDANFTITLTLPGQSSKETSIHVTSAEGNHGAYFNSSSESSREITVCVRAKDDSSVDKYNISVQTKSNSCGFSSLGSKPHDFSIYAQPIAYSVPSRFSINFNAANNQKVLEYLRVRHNNTCSNGCIIPIKITSNQEQTLTINKMEIGYLSSSGFEEIESTNYEIIKIPTLISMNYTLLDLSKSGLTVPSVDGNYTLNFGIGSYSKSKQISVSDMPGVGFVFPYETIIFQDTKFSAYSSSGNITSYKWNFGDNTPEQTTFNNTAIHKYSSLGNYTLNITAISSRGPSYSSFQINVVALSKEVILGLLTKNRNDLINIETEINKLPTWLRDYLIGVMAINNTKAELNGFISSVNSTANLTAASSYLNSLNIASSFSVSESSSGALIVNPNKINPTFFKNAGAGNMNSDVDENFYKNAIYSWLIDNMNINVEEKVYSLFYSDRNEPAGSYFKVTLTPKNGYAGKLFLAIDKNSNNIVFKDKQQTKNESQATIIVMNGSSSSREIEFFVNERVDPADIPIYLSPEFSKLNIFSNPKCFIDGECDSSIGEDAETCPADCASNMGKIIISIIILLVLAFIAYIILQEWYKRKYEDHLFKSKDDLYNVINFISNGEKQSMSKDEIFRNLLDMKWSNEQIIFAYKKLHGQRTGMYEIPIFKIFERNKVQTEIEKRKVSGSFGTSAPTPMIMPPQTSFMGGNNQNKNLPQNQQNKKI